MSSMNPMFNRSIKPVPQTKQRPKPNGTTAPRKKRADAKNDVKIPLTLEQRQMMKKLAKNKRLSVTTYCSELLEVFLRRGTDFRQVEYSPADKKTVHAKLVQSDYDMLFEYSVRWDCSLRQAAHRILTTAIKIEKEVWANEKF